MLPGQFPAISHRCTFNLTYSYNCSINIWWDGKAKIDNQWARYCGRAIQIWIQIQSIDGLFKFEFRFNQWAGLICNPEIWKFQIQRCEKRLDIAVASRILPWREFRPNSLPSSLYSFTALNLFPWVQWIQIHLQKSKYLWNIQPIMPRWVYIWEPFFYTSFFFSLRCSDIFPQESQAWVRQ